MTHPINDCLHQETFNHISKTLDRLDANTLRQAEAMEELARQAVMVNNHEKRLDKHDSDLHEAFVRFRVIEAKQAKEQGAEEVIEKSTKFWENVKIQLADKLVLVGIFLFLAADKLNIGMRVAKLWEEIFGGGK